MTKNMSQIGSFPQVGVNIKSIFKKIETTTYQVIQSDLLIP